MTFNELVPMLGKLYRNARKAPGFNVRLSSRRSLWGCKGASCTQLGDRSKPDCIVYYIQNATLAIQLWHERKRICTNADLAVNTAETKTSQCIDRGKDNRVSRSLGIRRVAKAGL